jgi:hypothetical protein
MDQHGAFEAGAVPFPQPFIGVAPFFDAALGAPLREGRPLEIYLLRSETDSHAAGRTIYDLRLRTGRRAVWRVLVRAIVLGGGAT